MSISPLQHSEVARLREQIAREIQAACLGLHGPASGTAKHSFITHRYDQIGHYQEQLATLVGEQQSMEIVLAEIEQMPEPGAKHG